MDVTRIRVVRTTRSPQVFYTVNRRPDPIHSTRQGNPQINPTSARPVDQGPTRSQQIARAGIMAALVAVLTVTAVPLPPPLSTITLAPVAIFVAATFLGPAVGFIAATVGSGVGFVVATNVGTINISGLPPVVFPIFLVGIMVARGPEGLIIGLLRKRNEAGAMVGATVFETLVFFVIDYFFTYPVVLGISREFAFLDFGTLVDLIFIPPALLVLRRLRGRFKVKYLDDVPSLDAGRKP